MQALANQTSQTLSHKLGNALLLPQVLTASIELLINKALQLNTQSINTSGLAHRTLTLSLTELPFPLSFTFNKIPNSVEVIVRAKAEQSHCTISTSISTLKELKAQASLTQLIKQDQLDVEGDLNVAQQFAQVAQTLQIDWQTELAKHLGDVPTHNILHFGNKITNKVVKTTKQVESDVAEYLVHEKRLVVTSSQIKAFSQQVTAVANKLETLSKRIDKLIDNKLQTKD